MSTQDNTNYPPRLRRLPKSVFTYYGNDGDGNVKFSVEGWKERDIEAAGFSEA